MAANDGNKKSVTETVLEESNIESKCGDSRINEEQDLRAESEKFLPSGAKVDDDDEANQGSSKKSGSDHDVGQWLKSHLGPGVLCPSLDWPLKLTTVVLLGLLFWGASYTLLKDNVAPQASLFKLAMLFVLAYIAGQLVALLRVPPLLGMLLVGIAMRNMGFFTMTGPYVNVVSILRNVAMVVILIKAGLGLDAGALKRLSLVVLRLAFIPCLVEALTVALVSHFLMGLPWLWGMLLGFVLGAVSPAVVVPSLLSLKERGYGEDKGISTLVIAASSIDDIVAISGYGVILGTIFSEGDLTEQILQGPLEVVIGLTFGVCWGIVMIYIPHRDDRWLVPGRAFMVGAGGLFAVLGSQMVGFSGAGPLACITAAFVGCYGWKMLGWSSSCNPVEKTFSMVWEIFQPILFGLIGTEIDLFQLEGHTVGYGIAVLAVGLTIRIFASFLAVCGGTLNLKERFFVAISWFPKATVQAALGPVALDLARKREENHIIEGYASQVLTLAVLSILITAPIGAVGIYLAGPRLLSRVKHSPHSICNEA